MAHGNVSTGLELTLLGQLDWERYKGRTEALEHKSSRSERDNNALMKHQIDLEASAKVTVFMLIVFEHGG